MIHKHPLVKFYPKGESKDGGEVLLYPSVGLSFICPIRILYNHAWLNLKNDKFHPKKNQRESIILWSQWRKVILYKLINYIYTYIYFFFSIYHYKKMFWRIPLSTIAAINMCIVRKKKKKNHRKGRAISHREKLRTWL